MLRVLSAVALLCCYAAYQVEGAGLREEFRWTFMNYVWPENGTACPTDKAAPSAGPGDAITFPRVDDPPRRGYIPLRTRAGEEEQTPEYILENNIPMGATRYKNKVFVTVPRRRPGIPATLNYVDLDCPARTNVPLRPFPSWQLNSLQTQRPADAADLSTPFVSVYRTTVDACDRLWFVDMGTLEYPTGRQQLQQFTLVVIDLATERVIRRFPFSVADANPLATLASVTVDVTKDTCDDAFAYIPDLVNYKLLVYSWRANDAWRVTHNYFFLDPLSGDFDIGGHQFQWNDGIFSVTLSDVAANGFRTAFFHSMASTKEFSVNTRLLRNRTMATRSYHGNDFKLVGDRGKNGQSSTHELQSSTGIFLMGEVNKNGLYCWNIKKDTLTHRSQDVIHADADKMIYPSDVKIDQHDNVWMMTNSMPRFLYGTLDYSQINFRIWTNSIKNAVAGTRCQ